MNHLQSVLEDFVQRFVSVRILSVHTRLRKPFVLGPLYLITIRPPVR